MLRLMMAVLALTLLGSCDFIGGGELIVRGDDNLVVHDPNRDRAAALFSRFEATPAVSDEDLEKMYAVIREQALAGELDAIVLMLRLAEFQRLEVADEEETPEKL